MALASRWRRVRTRTARAPSFHAIAIALAFPATLFWDDYRVRVIVSGANGAFDAVRTLTLAVSVYGTVEILLGLLARPRPGGFLAVAAGLLITVAAGLAAALLSIG